MDLQQIINALELETYPDCFEALFTDIKDGPACDLALIEKAQQEYEAFGSFYDWVVEAAQQVNADPIYNAFVKIVHAYLCDPSRNFKDLPVPPLNGTPKRDGAMLMSLVPFVPASAATYLKGGFSQEETAGYLHAYGNCLNSTKIRTGLIGLDRTYFLWLHRFAKAQIFRVHGIQFEFTKLNKNCTYLKNKNTGLIQPVMSGGTIHASGKMLVGAGGYEDATGSFTGMLTETEDSYITYAVYDCVAQSETSEFPKTEWEIFAQPGDNALSMHLPRGADIREENVRKACAAAYEIIGKSYPDYVGAPVYCSSWLLDPALESFIGPDSNIVRFGKLFVRYPSKSPGRAANGFVFPGKPVPDAELPEDTRLQRAIKQHYLNGGYTYGIAGLLTI